MSGADDSDPFALLGLPRRYDIPPDELERRFHERSRAVHPDRFARAIPAERRASLERATRLNHAYRTLRDPWQRAACLIALLGVERGPEADADPGFLEEQVIAREELATARRRRDRPAIEALRARAVEACTTLERGVGVALAARDPGPSALRDVRRALVRARFHQALVEEANRALDGHGTATERT